MDRFTCGEDFSVQKKSEEDYIIQFYLCLCKNDRSEIKRLLKHQKNRSYYVLYGGV